MTAWPHVAAVVFAMLLLPFVQEKPDGRMEKSKPAAQEKPMHGDDMKDDMKKEMAASQPSSQPSQRKPAQTKVLEELIRQTEKPAPILSQTPTAQNVPNSALMLEGQALVERIGRFVHSGDHSEFQIKLDAGEKKPSSFPLNANSLLELMEREAASGNAEFIVSGWVSVYRGQNFLTLTKVRRQVPNGNLAP